MRQPIRLISADLDGTLLNSVGEIGDYDIQMIRKAQAAGILFAINTGRFPENVAQIALDAGIHCPVISLNGAVVELAPNAERIHEDFLATTASRAVFELLERLGEGYYMFGRGTVTSRRDWPRHISERNARQFSQIRERVHYTYGLEACKAALSQPQHKFFVYRSEEGLPLSDIALQLNTIPGIQVTQSGERNLEVMSASADKGHGLMLLARALHVDRAQVMALGDQHNDLSMIRWAGLGVAMGNAAPEVLEAADAVTDSHDANGVGMAIQRFCFPGELV